MSFICVECFDTNTIDHAGCEIPCPYCPPAQTVKITGLAHGLGTTGKCYDTAVVYGSSFITFQGTRSQILADVRRVRQENEGIARRQRVTGRNNISSGAIAIENRVRKALA